MILNPFRTKPRRFGNTRLITEDLGLVGRKIRDPRTRRVFTTTHVFSPVPTQAIGGLRIRGVDPHGFSSFLNQRDAEVLLDLARPGMRCPWLGSEYVDSSEHSWLGFGLETDDSIDDLLIREMEWIEANGAPTQGSSLLRYIHCSENLDAEEEFLYFNSKKWALPEQVGLRWNRAFREIISG